MEHISFNNVPEPPESLSKFAKAMTSCWSGGNVAMFAERLYDCWDILVYPALREVCGGRQDGSTLFTRFMLKLDKLQKLFDKTPDVVFDSAVGALVPYVHLCGKIDGEVWHITILSVPPPDAVAAEVYYAQGPKKGKLEPRIPDFSEGD